MNNLDEVRRASAAFYDALNKMAKGDDTAMQGVWIKGNAVTAQHPIGGRDIGSDTVLGSFSKVAEISGGGDIRLQDQLINAGSDMAIETGVEIGASPYGSVVKHARDRQTADRSRINSKPHIQGGSLTHLLRALAYLRRCGDKSDFKAEILSACYSLLHALVHIGPVTLSRWRSY